ncbi:uncharacterized protein LOC131063598 isoform X2 [Cryptomeria japonica]|uniref:uncharacterized protein LOC131063598 isoform X2 n=1 Tax=Cryptomeria japonica TaxID=3369 RepID=UPI0027DA22A1|nr:uncharacterized protein LOC131063598 isoform X2 [Cryptomeria japonica]
MTKGKTSSDCSSIRQFGQRSITSNLYPQVEGKKTNRASLSLIEFLDKKLDKRSEKSLEPCGADSANAFPRVLGGRASDVQPRISPAIASVFQLVKEYPTPSQPQDEATTPANDPCSKRALLKRKNVLSPDDFQQSPSGRLLVLGDDPKPKRRLLVQRRADERSCAIFNHYADGVGWWDTNMVGVDSDEVGTTEIWEGMGSTTIGGL